MKNFLNQSLGPIITLLYGGMIVYYYFWGYLAFLVNPIYDSMIIGAGVVLLILGMHGLSSTQTVSVSDCDTRKKNRSVLMFLLLLIPLVLGIFFKPQPLSSDSALLRGVSSNLSMSEFDPIAFAKPPHERTLLEWIRLVNMNPEPDHFKTQEVNIQGMMIGDDTLPENVFHIGQFILTCCAADARTIALPVRYQAGSFNPQSNQWIQLKGTMGEMEIEGKRQIIIDMDTAIPIDPPDKPYEFFK